MFRDAIENLLQFFRRQNAEVFLDVLFTNLKEPGTFGRTSLPEAAARLATRTVWKQHAVIGNFFRDHARDGNAPDSVLRFDLFRLADNYRGARLGIPSLRV